MEDSRKGKRSKKKGFPTPDPHVDGGNGNKAIDEYSDHSSFSGSSDSDSSSVVVVGETLRTSTYPVSLGFP